MGIYGKETEFSSDQAITATAASTKKIQTGPGDFGQGEKMDLDVIVTEDFNNLTSLKVQLRTDDNSSMSSPTVVYESADILLASLVAGYKIPMRGFPAGLEEWCDLNYVVTGTNPTTGKIDAGMTPWSEESNPNFS